MEKNNKIPTKQFGSTGHNSTRTLFGAASLGRVSQDEADRTLEVLVDYGVNHIDVAAGYGNGEAEKRMAPWFPKYRDTFFLATKTGKRSYDEAKADFHGSLERMGVSKVDLIQLHNLVDADQWAEAMGSHGALKALVEARDEGLVDHIGVTGHGFGAPRAHIRSLGEFEFASVLLPYNWRLMQEESYRRDFEELVSLCREKGVAVQTIKSIARRPWQGERRRSCWYEPLEEQDRIDKAVSWVLGNPDVFLNTVGDINLLPRVLEAATKSLPRPSDEEMAAMANETDMELIFEGNKAMSGA
jgi:aryl-alcohol dehydrogenase-like predicted oxidoreductase